MNCKMLFLKRTKLVKVILLDFSGREELVLETIMFDIEPRNVVDIISCSICCPRRTCVLEAPVIARAA